MRDTVNIISLNNYTFSFRYTAKLLVYCLFTTEKVDKLLLNKILQFKIFYQGDSFE